LPLALATGASAASSHHIGTTVVAGMASVAILASIFVPSFYSLIARVQAWLARKRGK
jgi:HAE1 family hydrophobic/amphiphilic exporter-1/multidrug efflux pump